MVLSCSAGRASLHRLQGYRSLLRQRCCLLLFRALSFFSGGWVSPALFWGPGKKNSNNNALTGVVLNRPVSPVSSWVSVIIQPSSFFFVDHAFGWTLARSVCPSVLSVFTSSAFLFWKRRRRRRKKRGNDWAFFSGDSWRWKARLQISVVCQSPWSTAALLFWAVVIQPSLRGMHSCQRRSSFSLGIKKLLLRVLRDHRAARLVFIFTWGESVKKKKNEGKPLGRGEKYLMFLLPRLDLISRCLMHLLSPRKS